MASSLAKSMFCWLNNRLTLASDKASFLASSALKIKDKAGSCGTIRLEYASYYVEHYCHVDTYPSLLEKLCEQLIKVLQETRQCLEDWFKQGNRFSVPLPNGSCNGLGRDLPDREEQICLYVLGTLSQSRARGIIRAFISTINQGFGCNPDAC